MQVCRAQVSRGSAAHANLKRINLSTEHAFDGSQWSRGLPAEFPDVTAGTLKNMYFPQHAKLGDRTNMKHVISA